MPLIPNYISRLRTHSQSTAASSSSHSGSHSNSTAGPSTPGSELARFAADPLVEHPEDKSDQKPRSRVGRKIHPDLSTLLDEDMESEAVVEDLGPRPPRRRSQSAEQLRSTRPDVVSQGDTDVQDGPVSESAAATPSSPRSPLLSRILSAPPPSDVNSEPDSSGTAHWSTFGRRRPLASVGESGSLNRRGSGSKSPAHSKSSRHGPKQKSAPATPSTTRAPSISARASAPSRAQTTETAPSQQNSPAATISSSSKSFTGHSQSLRSRRPPLVPPEPIPDAEPVAHLDPQTPARVSLHPSFTLSPNIASPLAARQTLDDSPHTFGRATPKESDPRSNPYPRLGGGFVTPSSDPPTQRKTATRREPPATFPQRRRTRSRPATTGSLVSFPSLSRRSASARFRAEDVFQPGEHRRFSANWSAVEAVKDGGGHQGESWPATVSREMVRLSLRARKAAVGVEEAAIVGEEGVLADGHVKNVTLFGSTGEDRRRFMWAGRRRANTGSVVLTQSSSSAHQKSALEPAFSVSPPSGSGSAPDTTTRERTNNGGLAPHVSVTAPTPSASPSGSHFGTISDPTPRPHLNSDSSPSHGQGKRKIADADADAEDEGPSERPKASLLSGGRGSSTRASDASHAPSSFRQTKRIRLSTPSHSPEHLSRSASHSPHISPPGSPRSRPPSSLRTLPNPRSVSQSSIPLRAIMSPRPPSVDRRSNYHMRDPALPPPLRQSTQWVGGARRSEDGRRVFPLQGWAFMLGFVLFPIWWAAAVAPVGWGWGWRTRSVQDGKGSWVKDEDLEAQGIWEYDVAFTWRRRCRLMSLLGLLVYIPLIVLLTVLVPRT